MTIQNMIGDTAARDIIPIFTGHEICKKSHSFGPHVRNYYLIHFCLGGKGELSDKHGRHKINKGELFIIRPGEPTTYTADSEEPWEYTWISFGGDMASIFDTGRSVYPFPKEIGKKLLDLTEDGVDSPAAYISLIYELIYRLFTEERESGGIARRVKRYIKFNYMNDISVMHLSEYFGFERSYLYKVFRSSEGIGIKEYIIKVRMEQAEMLLKKGYSVSDTARAVGYRDQFNFSKAYKKFFGVSPRG